MLGRQNFAQHSCIGSYRKTTQEAGACTSLCVPGKNFKHIVDLDLQRGFGDARKTVDFWRVCLFFLNPTSYIVLHVVSMGVLGNKQLEVVALRKFSDILS